MGVRVLVLCWCLACVWCPVGGVEPAAGGGRSGAMEILRTVFEVPGVDSGNTGTVLMTGRRRRVRRAPPFMMALYEAVAPDPMSPLRGHVVRSYGESGVNTTTTDVIAFDISGMGPTEEVVEAELHLYRIERKPPAPLRSIVESSNITTPYYLVRVYQCLSADHSFPLDSHRLLGVQHVTATATLSEGWHVVNVMAAVADWLAGRRPNLGFLVHVAASSGRPLGPRVQFARRGAGDREPALVVFTRKEEQEVAKQTAVRRRWRSVVDGVSIGAVHPLSVAPHSTAAPPRPEDHCRLQDLWVDFGDVGLSKWLVAPVRFNCGQCVGPCGFRDRKTNHAALLSALRRLGGRPRTARRPTCTPTALRPLTTLSCHPEGKHCALRVLEDLVAEGCGCH